MRRATELAAEQGLQNVSFSVMDALKMTHEADKYDLVWACESGEHMPDKRTYVEEMARVLKPGATIAESLSFDMMTGLVFYLSFGIVAS